MMNQPKAMKLEIVPQSKQGCQVTRNWLDLPSELVANILYRVGVKDILESAQKVCTTWHEICKDPAMWRVIYMDAFGEAERFHLRVEMCKNAVDRSQGQLVDITILEFRSDEILQYIANRSSQLKRLTSGCCFGDDTKQNWRESLKNWPLLEELSVYAIKIKNADIETAGRYCPMLKTLKLNQIYTRFWDNYFSFWDEYFRFRGEQDIVDDEIAMAIGQHLHELRHLEVIGSTVSNEGLKMILDGCHHLESLDLRGCLLIDLDGDLGKRCLQQIKSVKRPEDYLEECPYKYMMA